ncbi:MAG: cytochrome c3 family protein [Acidobacteria bacterium]|nr:cytochrome c3 family protein [Acidobacteriota bacterium]
MLIFATFVVVRHFAVPAGFGQFGHYRGPVLAEIRTRPITFAGRQACADCHTDMAEKLATGRHKTVGCESCHGPQAAHARSDDPSAHKPPRPNPPVLCARCHEKNSTKPTTFPQVAAMDHSGGEKCTTCHNPHQPKPGA